MVTRTHRLLIRFFVLYSFFSYSANAEQHNGNSPEFKTTTVTENIQLLQGKGGNIALLTGPQGLLLVDDDYKEMSAPLKQALKHYGGPEKLTYIINTHWHGDHTGGNIELGSTTQIIAHDNVRIRLLTTQEIKLFGMVKPPYPEHALPSLTYDKTLNLHINDETIRIAHYPNGHTDGDSVVFFNKANVVHMGDHYFSGFFPFVDVDHGGNVVQLATNIKHILALIDDNTHVIPGHGPLSTKADLRDYYDMLLGTTAEVRAFKNQKLTLAQIQAKGLNKRWDSWTDGFLSTDTWISIIYNSL